MSTASGSTCSFSLSTPDWEKVRTLNCDGTQTASNCSLQARAASSSSRSVSSMLRLTRKSPRCGSATGSPRLRAGSRRLSGMAQTPLKAACTTSTTAGAWPGRLVVVGMSDNCESSSTSIRSITERVDAGHTQVSLHLLVRTKSAPNLWTNATSKVTASISMPVQPHSRYQEIWKASLAMLMAGEGVGEGEVLWSAGSALPLPSSTASGVLL
mmetsp:Transcript_9949/g.27086  ORF Transcript_9949/g.27086 Transcript_9949/m.27086 type:complete len:212 (+) Transcript_9949:799-1434(+)